MCIKANMDSYINFEKIIFESKSLQELRSMAGQYKPDVWEYDMRIDIDTLEPVYILRCYILRKDER